MSSPNKNKPQSSISSMVFDYSVPGSVVARYEVNGKPESISWSFSDWDERAMFSEFVSCVMQSGIPYSFNK